MMKRTERMRKRKKGMIEDDGGKRKNEWQSNDDCVKSAQTFTNTMVIYLV